jgi:hypothetical protein
MNTSLAGTGFQDLFLRSEHASVPMRSPATSIVLAEAVRRGQQARESSCSSRAAAFLPPWLEFVRQADVALDTKVSTIFTPAGPLVYRWRQNELGSIIKPHRGYYSS